MGFLFAIIGLSVCLGLAFAIAKSITEGYNKAFPSKAATQTVSKKCPHCHHTASASYRPGLDPLPVYFACPNCLSAFGDETNVTSADKQRVMNELSDCQRVDHMQELNEIKQMILNEVDHLENSIVIFKDCKVSVADGHGNLNTLTYFSGPTTDTGIQHLAIICKNYCEYHAQHYRTYDLTNLGFRWTTYD